MDARADAPEPDELLAQLGWVRALAGRLVSDPDVTDDVLQQVCLLALQRAPSEARTGLRLRAWLVNVTRRLAQHSHRSSVRRLRREQAAARAEALPSTVDAVVHREALQGLVSAVTALQEPYYSVVVARYFEGRSVADIATLSGASSEAVRQQLARARQQLRARLQALLADDRRAWLLAMLPQSPAPAVLTGSVSKVPLAYLGGILVAKSTSAVATAICLGLVVTGAVLFLGSDDRSAPGAPVVDHAQQNALEPTPAAAPALPVFESAGPLLLGNAPRDGSAAANAPAVGRLVVRVIWATDRTPAAGVGIRAMFWSLPDPVSSMRDGLTDASGHWELPDAPAGSASIFLDRAGYQKVEVPAGAAAELTLEIPAGVFVRGRVLDADEHAVAGADISLQFGPESLAVVAQTGADGRFTVRDVGEHLSLGARIEGHVPSPMYVIADDGTHQCDLTLRLGSAGAHLVGRVVDTAGVPVAGVVVRVGGLGWPAPENTNGLLVNGQPPRRVITDPQGAFSARDLPPGSTPVAMRVHGHSPWSGTVTLHLGENDPLEVVLQDSAVVHGVVSDESGKPIAGVRVSTGDYGDMDWVATKSGSDGRFELADLPLLDRELTALLKGWGKVTTQLSVSPGATLEWNPQLVSGLQIFGRVVDARGAPVIGHHVEGRAYGPGEPTSVETDTDQQGRFTLRNCADLPHILTVRTPDGSTDVASKRDVRPGPDEILLQVGDTRRSAFIIGRVVDAHARAPQLAAVEARDPRIEQGEPSAVQADTGNFRIGPLLPGEWDLYVVAGHSPWRKYGPFQLAADGTLDVGTITLPATGRVIAHVTLPEGVVPGDVKCQLVSADHRSAGFLTLQDTSQPVWFADEVEAGNYEVILGSTSGGPERIAILPTHAPVHVEADKDAEVDIVAERGVAQTILLSTVRLNPPGPWVRVTNAAGVAVWDQPVQWDQPAPGTSQHAAHTRFIALPGAYTLVIKSDGREVVQQALMLPDEVNVAPEVSVVVP